MVEKKVCGRDRGRCLLKQMFVVGLTGVLGGGVHSGLHRLRVRQVCIATSCQSSTLSLLCPAFSNLEHCFTILSLGRTPQPHTFLVDFDRPIPMVFQCFHFYRAAWNADAVQRWEFCLSVRLSVRLSNACIVTKRKKNLSRFLYHAKDHSVQFYEQKNGWWGRPLLSEILGQPACVGAKSPILNK